jgi:hypothetical protein
MTLICLLLLSFCFCFFDWCISLVRMMGFFFIVGVFFIGKGFFSVYLILDCFNYFFLLLLAWVLFLVLLRGFVDYIVLGYFTGFVVLFVMVGLFLCVCFAFFNFLGFYLFFEFVFFAFFVLLLVWSYSPERLQASYYILFFTLFLTFPFLFYVLNISKLGFRDCFFVFCLGMRGLGYS